MTKIKVIKNMIVSIDTPPIDTHKYCLVNWLYNGITLTAQLDGTFMCDQGNHYEFNNEKVFETRDGLINFHATVIISEDLKQIATPYPVNILISAWLSPKGYQLIKNEIKKYDECIFKNQDQYRYNDYLNHYIQYKKPVHEIKKYIILDKEQAVIRKWARHYNWSKHTIQFFQKQNTINFYQYHGLKIHASCMKTLQYFYQIIKFNKVTMMKWLIFNNFLLPI